MIKAGLKAVIIFVSLICLLKSSIASDDSRVTYEKDINQVMEAYCHDCHGEDAPTVQEYNRNRDMYHKLNLCPRMETYKSLMYFVNGRGIGVLQQRLEDGKGRDDGVAGSMYVYLGETEDERQKNLQLFKDWVGNWVPKRPHEVEAELDSEWLADVLDGKAAVAKPLEEALDDIRKTITAPEK